MGHGGWVELQYLNGGGGPHSIHREDVAGGSRENLQNSMGADICE